MFYKITYTDVLIGVIYFFICLFFINRTNKNSDLKERKVYTLNFLYSCFFSLVFSLVYYVLYGGGDSLAYYLSTRAINNLFFIDFEAYYNQMFHDYVDGIHLNYFDRVNYPPGWIFREKESFFVAKIISFISFFTFQSFFALNIIMSTLNAVASWKCYTFFVDRIGYTNNYFRFAFLFIPSVNFWCSGLSKDTVIYISLMFIIPLLFKLKHHENKFSRILLICFFTFLIYNIRSFILAAIFAPYLFALFNKGLKNKIKKPIIRTLSQILLLLLLFGSTYFFSENNSSILEIGNSYLEEAALVQNDFSNNQAYGSNRYSLGKTDFSIIGLIRTSPVAIWTAIYKPYLWEAFTPTLFMNGIESLFLIFLTIKFLLSNFFNKIGQIINNEVLLFSLILILIIGLMTGITSVLFGVLVRLRAPILPFTFLLLTLNPNKKNS